MNTSDALQLLTAGIAGIAAYRLFWTVRTSSTPLDEAAGIFFWGIAGVGMLYLAADDYFGLHETMGDAMASRTSMIPMFTNTADDIITVFVGVTGLTVLYMFRNEVFARRASSALLVGGVAAAAVMTLTDVYGHGVIRPLEFPAQVAASGLLMLAFTRRYFEVRCAAPANGDAHGPGQRKDTNRCSGAQGRGLTGASLNASSPGTCRGCLAPAPNRLPGRGRAATLHSRSVAVSSNIRASAVCLSLTEILHRRVS